MQQPLSHWLASKDTLIDDLNTFSLLKNELSNAALQRIYECLPFVVRCGVSIIAILATLNQGEDLLSLCLGPYKEMRFIILLLKKSLLR